MLSHLCPTLCDATDCSPPGSSLHRILQARILEWVAMPSSRGSIPDPGIEPASLTSHALAGGFFMTVREPHLHISKLSEGALLKPLNNQNQCLFSKEISKAIGETIASWPLGLS